MNFHYDPELDVDRTDQRIEEIEEELEEISRREEELLEELARAVSEERTAP